MRAYCRNNIPRDIRTHLYTYCETKKEVSLYFISFHFRYIAFSLERYNRIWLTLLVYSGIACMVGFVLFMIKFFEREEFPFDTFEYAVKALSLFPLQGTKL